MFYHPRAWKTPQTTCYHLLSMMKSAQFSMLTHLLHHFASLKIFHIQTQHMFYLVKQLLFGISKSRAETIPPSNNTTETAPLAITVPRPVVKSKSVPVSLIPSGGKLLMMSLKHVLLFLLTNSFLVRTAREILTKGEMVFKLK